MTRSDWLGSLALGAAVVGICAVCLHAPAGWPLVFLAMAWASLAAAW